MILCKHAAWAAAGSVRVGCSLEQAGIGLVDLDDTGERLDTEVGECHDGGVAYTIDPDQAVFLVHFVGNVPQPLLILPEHFGDAGDGVDVVNLDTSKNLLIES